LVSAETTATATATAWSARARAPRYDRLTAAQCDRLHAASLEILGRTGVRMHLPEAVERLRHAGAAVDGDRVRIPAHLVEWALAVAPREVVLYDRLGRPAIPCGNDHVAFGPGSDCLHVLDHRTGERRRARLADVEAGVRLCDALERIEFVMSLFTPDDVEPALADRVQMAVMLRGTTKPIVAVTYGLESLIDVVAMAEAVAGGAEALRTRPFLAAYINVTSGLVHNAEALGKLIALAQRGLPALWIPVTSGATTGPVTTAGNVAVNTAGVLAGLVLAQLVREGTPVIVPGFGGDALDLRTMVDPYAEPDPRGVVPSLTHRYGLPMFSLAAGSDAKVVDQQAAAEAALTMLYDALAGGNLVHDCGYLESGLTGSLPLLVICDELAAWIRAAIAPVEISDETLALDVVERLGPDGTFLEEEHTLAHYRERWYPELLDRRAHAAWHNRGALTLEQRASERVDHILATHLPEPLPPAADRAIDQILERAAGLTAGRGEARVPEGGPG
jgi:trimethylamine---corrinoid protein Co-methyltransferase